jgi:hypothetical protein
MMAVGPGSLINAVNTALRIQSRTGDVIAPATEFSSFFAPVATPGDGFSDPQVMYDDLAGRYYIGALELNAAGNADFDFAVSKGSSPTDFTSASWTEFSKISSVEEGGADFADFPKMGWNSDAVFVSFNQFPNAGGPVHDLILSISKGAILAGTPLVQNSNYFQADVTTDSGLGDGDYRIFIPARMHGAQPGNLEYFVERDQDLTYETQSTVNVVTAQDYLSGGPAFASCTFTVNPYQDCPGTYSTTQIDDRMLSADWVNDTLVAAQDVGTVGGEDTLARWYEFNTSGSITLSQEGDINLGAGIDTSYPSIAVNSLGDIGMTFIGSNKDGSLPPSVYVTARLAGDAPNTMQPPVLVQFGAPYASQGSRSGDYSATEYDPMDDTFWAVNEYNIDSGSTDDWGTAIAQFKVGPPMLFQATAPLPADANLAPLTIHGNGFDPSGTNSVTITDLTHPADTVTVSSTTVNSSCRITVTISGTFTGGDVLSAVATIDGVSSAPAAVATVVPVLTPTTTPALANTSLANLVIQGFGFDPNGTNTVTITDLTRPTDTINVGNTAVNSASQISIAFAGTFTPGDLLSMVVTTDGASSVPVIYTQANFTNYGPLGTPWSVPSGGFTTTTGSTTMSGTNSSEANDAVLNDIFVSDVSESVTVGGMAPGQAAGLVARYCGPGDDNMDLGWLDNIGGTVYAQIWRSLDGSWSQLTSQALAGIDPSSPATLRFEAYGSTLKLFVDDTLQAFAYDSLLTSGQIGIRSSAGPVVDNFQAELIGALVPTTPFSDNFATPSDGSQLSRDWTDQLGNVTINECSQALGTAGFNLSTVNGINLADQKAVADINLTTGQTFGLVTRYQGPLYSNFYLGQLRDTGSGFQAAIFKNIGGVFTTLSFGATVSSGYGTLEFEAVGPSLKLIFNGNVVAYADDQSLGAGSVGMRLSSGVAVHNFQADSIALPTPTLPFSDDFSSSSDGLQLDRAWTDQLGNIAVSGSQAVGVGEFNLSTVSGISQSDVKVTANVALGPSQNIGLVARYGGPGNSSFYLGQLRGLGDGQFQAAIFSNIGGTFNTLAIGSTVGSGTGTLEFEVVGSSLKLILNNQLVAYAQDGSITAPGSVGMRLGQGVTLGNFNASAITLPAKQALPFTDNFSNPGDGSQLSTNWSDQNGNIAVVNGVAIGEGDFNLSTVNGINVADITVEGEVGLIPGAGQSAGLVARYAGPLYSNFYLAQFRDIGNGLYQAAIFKNIGGIFSLVALGSTTTQNAGTFKFILTGSTLEVELDASVLVTAVDTSITGPGSAGIRLSYGATLGSFDAS